jgi:O-succinylbenzoic acid--CoA ligase
VRGPMLTRGYRNGVSPITTDGWLPTGDLGGWTDDGRLHVDGRKGDLIISGGENIWPEAVEALVAAHPDVADVMARGVDDAEWGQIVEVVVVPVPGRTPDLESIRLHVKQSAPSYLAPKSLILVELLSRTALGKLRRSV